MFDKQVCVYFIFILINIRISGSISIQGIVDIQNPDRMIVLPNMKNTGDLRTEGIFERFIRHLLELLTTAYPERKLPKYCRILSRYINKLQYKYAQRFAKHTKYWSRMYPEDLKTELFLLKKELGKKRPHRTAFLEAINEAFTLRENVLFDDYIYELRNYGTEDKLYIGEDTEKLVNDVILGRIRRMSSSDREDIQRKLKHAVREFLNVWNVE